MVCYGMVVYSKNKKECDFAKTLLNTGQSVQTPAEITLYKYKLISAGVWTDWLVFKHVFREIYSPLGSKAREASKQVSVYN